MDAIPPAQIRVIDGDTFRAGRETIRIENIDAPETGRGARCTGENYLSQIATERLREILASGPVSLERRGLDPFKRTLAIVRVNNQDVGRMMIEYRLAVPWAGKVVDDRRDSLWSAKLGPMAGAEAGSNGRRRNRPNSCAGSGKAARQLTWN